MIIKEASATSEEDSNLLVLVIDTNPFIWHKLAQPPTSLSIYDALHQLIIFLNAHLALKHDNLVAVIASHTGESKFLYPIPSINGSTVPNGIAASGGTAEGGNERGANVYQQFREVDDQVVKSVRELFENASIDENADHQGTSLIAGALSMALCYIHRITRLDELGRVKPRILVVSVSPDSPFQYIPIMNCIFSAQKSSIPVDVCKIHGEDSVFLQQAANITGGVYLKLDDQLTGLLQYLLFNFLPDRYSRQFLCLPGQDQVDYRAACFCHKRIIDIGYVCSVCLSIFCSFSPVCTTCRTKFAFRALPTAAPAGARAKPRNGSAPGSGRSTPSHA
ncbi:uncharacterized protein VTP21DRAFT_2461 [Calcarisporiella thermophila]|uniref:uncharacterized protein n=1 Tax=Calcarisporiella thermophila TaxID=911321 RepID=UPI0037425EA4